MDTNKYWSRFSPLARMLLRAIIQEFKFSFSNQLKLMIYTYEISRRERISVPQILLRAGLLKLWFDHNIQGKLRSRILLEKLFEIRYPETSKLISQGIFKL